jgi:phosphatidylglycerophosphate synthase
MANNIPNIITYFRIALIPCLMVIFYLPETYLEIYQKIFGQQQYLS